jgi:hypothetical protein
MMKTDQELIEESWQKFKSADENNRLRIGDAADALFSICLLIEKLDASPLQTEISLRASELMRRMKEQSK